MKKINTHKTAIFFQSELLAAAGQSPFVGFTIKLQGEFHSLFIPVAGNQYTAEVALKESLIKEGSLNLKLHKLSSFDKDIKTILILDLLWEYKAQAEKYKQTHE